ncbi:hypothetical protein BC938DRAFT_482370, partial [Jimgerdemannia flammicorona]
MNVLPNYFQGLEIFVFAFQVRTTDDLRKVLAARLSLNKADFDNEWIELNFLNLDNFANRLMHYEDRCEALKKDHLEGWYDINIWSLIVVAIS